MNGPAKNAAKRAWNATIHPVRVRVEKVFGTATADNLCAEFDFTTRELGYRTDPMNVLPQKVFGEEEFNRRLNLRIGVEQMAEARR